MKPLKKLQPASQHDLILSKPTAQHSLRLYLYRVLHATAYQTVFSAFSRPTPLTTCSILQKASRPGRCSCPLRKSPASSSWTRLICQLWASLPIPAWHRRSVFTENPTHRWDKPGLRRAICSQVERVLLLQIWIIQPVQHQMMAAAQQVWLTARPSHQSSTPRCCSVVRSSSSSSSIICTTKTAVAAAPAMRVISLPTTLTSLHLSTAACGSWMSHGAPAATTPWRSSQKNPNRATGTWERRRTCIILGWTMGMMTRRVRKS